MSPETSQPAIDRVRNASRKLHHSYGVNWTIILLTLGLSLFAHVMGAAARYEHSKGNLTAAQLDSLIETLWLTQIVIIAFFLLMCVHWWLGPPEGDDA